MYTAKMQESIKKVEATRAARMAAEPRRMTAEEEDTLHSAHHPDYKEDGLVTLEGGPNKGEEERAETVLPVARTRTTPPRSPSL